MNPARDGRKISAGAEGEAAMRVCKWGLAVILPAALAERLGVKEERSRQLEREALHRLRELPRSRHRAA